MKTTLKVYVGKFVGSDSFYVSHHPLVGEHIVPVGSFEHDFEIPAEFNETAILIQQLNKKLETETEAFHTRVARLKSQITDLQCIEHVVPA
jgi:hypothetical protein